ncbi:Asp-tRNA(Asn)/Glu-tRNA(Gln) amidotransferase subunit GatB [Candidatus Woesearchaeota archaeon]|nr:Asp-tRNA(Asn)/Glu-tRNA(Gln) amidotransferase subunit GatB [Candidatus Woesearchaeota archaeon]
MILDSSLLDKIAANSRLAISAQEKDALLPQLQEILDAFSKLENATGKGTTHPVPIQNIWRADEEKPCLDKDAALQNTHTRDPFFLGPRTMK